MSGFLNSMVGATYAAPVPPETYYFAATVGDAGDTNPAVACDPDGNAYGAFETFSSTLIGNRDIYFYKRDSSGVFQWARRIGISSPSNRSLSNINIGVTSYGYAQVLFTDSGNQTSNLYILDSSNGDILAAKNLIGSDVTKFNISGANTSMVVRDSQMWVFGITTDDISTTKHSIMSFDPTAGTIDWARQITLPANTRVGGITSNATGSHVWILFGDGANTHVAKYSGSGAIQWQRKITYSSQDIPRYIAVDSTGAVYVSGNYSGGGGWFAKIASDGNSVLYTKTITDTYVVGSAFTLNVDADDNVYISARTVSNAACVIIKFNSSGTLQYRRTITPASNTLVTLSSAINATSLFIVGNHTFSTADHVLFELPLDGSKTGTYSLNGKNFTYAENTTVTVATTPSATIATTTLATSSTAGSSTDFTGYTTNTTSLTNYLTTL
jgi:hypothetical protein